MQDLKMSLRKSEAREGVHQDIASHWKKQLEQLHERNQWLEKRNAELENPKGSHYNSLSWPGRIIMCIKKLKRPLRFQEIMQELMIMERLHNTESWLTEKTISVTLSNMGKDGRLHSEKLKGTRGNFYALIEWLEEDGKLNEKMKRRLW